MWAGSSSRNRRIAIVGVGQVGGAVAYALILQTLASEILLVDEDIERRDGQVRDLSDVSYGHGSQTRVRSATHREAGQCDIVVITAGSKYTLGRSVINISCEHNVISHRVSRPDESRAFASQCIDYQTSDRRNIAVQSRQYPNRRFKPSGPSHLYCPDAIGPSFVPGPRVGHIPGLRTPSRPGCSQSRGAPCLSLSPRT